ncbi:MAG: recombinase family protein [Bdellovibrionaceae bacterium]|nr:recombinase family protein [Pseudobdellovibrionaceae bacterium]
MSEDIEGKNRQPLDQRSPKNGGPSHRINEHQNHHDFIELSPRTQSRIYEKCAPLYEKGLSIRDIESVTGIPKSTVREALTKSGMSLRNPINGNARHIDRLHTKRGGHTPYGYAYLDGQLLIDPREQIIVRKILKLHQSGMSGNAIAAELNRQTIPSRTGKTWRPCVVRRIIKANQTKKTKK